MTDTRERPAWSVIRKLAVEADCDPRTVLIVWKGERRPRTMAALRAAKVLEAAGMSAPVRL